MYIYLLVVFILVINSGCANLMKAFSVESPRPNKEQITGVTSINNNSVPIIAGLQSDKQRRLEIVILKAIEFIPKCKTPEQVEALSNMVANALTAIKEADGTAKILGTFSGKSIEDIARMPFGEYMAYASMQGMAIAPQSREMVFQGIKTGFQWSALKIAGLVTGTGGLGGLIYTLVNYIGKARRRSDLLVATGKVIEDTATPEQKAELAKAHSVLPINVKKEFGIT